MPLFIVLLAGALASAEAREDLNQLQNRISAAFSKLGPQTIHTAEGHFKYDYLTPGGYYKGSMWDWDGFFIGCHWAHQSRDQAKFLKWWVLNFTDAVTALNKDGWVPGVLLADRLPSGKPHPIFGMFTIKPFLAQGAVIASERLGDYEWTRAVWDSLRRTQTYREKTQYDAKWGLFFWETAMQSGEDNNVALSNDPNDRNAVLAVDLCAFQLREYRAMARIAEKLGNNSDANEYRQKAEALRRAVLQHLWFAQDQTFWNVRGDTRQPVRRISGSNFIPLIEGLLPAADARNIIRRYLWNSQHMLAAYGLRSLSKDDPAYNNVSMIDPYSNWQGPVWVNTNYLYFLALKRYGFEQEAGKLAGTLARMVLADIRQWGSMHECYNADTGQGLAPTPEQSKDHVFPGFVGWNLLVEDMLQCETKKDCLTLDWPRQN